MFPVPPSIFTNIEAPKSRFSRAVVQKPFDLLRVELTVVLLNFICDFFPSKGIGCGVSRGLVRSCGEVCVILALHKC